MRSKVHRLTALLCAFCMLFASIPSSVLSDSIAEDNRTSVATPTDLQPAGTDEIIPNTDAEPVTQDSTQEPVIQDNSEPETGTQSTSESGKEIPDTHEPEKDIPESNETATGAPEETVPEKPQADRELEAGDDLTITGELEGEHPRDYLIRFTPEKNQTMVLVLTADKELKTTIKNENTGDGKALVKDHTDEDGMMTWTVMDYRVDKENTYLLRISAEKPAEFTLRLVRKSIYEQEQAEEETAEEAIEEPGEEPKDELADDAADAEPGKAPADKPAEQPGEESAEIPEEQPVEETTVDIQAEKDPDLPEMPETIGDDTTGEPEAEPEMEKPAADREITAGDDVTVSGEMSSSGQYLLRFTPDTDLTLYLILTADDAEATVTDEQTDSTKQFTPDSTVGIEQTVLTVPFYKTKTGNTYLIRISGTGAFTARLVRGSILKEEANRQDEPNEPEEAESNLSEETEENQAEEAAEEPAAEPEAVPDEPETEQKTVSGATEEPETKPEQAEKAAPETQAEQAVPEATAEAEMPAIQTDLELAEEKTPATQTDLDPAEEETPATWTDLEPVEIRIDAIDSDIEAYILFLSDAGIPEGTELQIRELTPEEQAAYQAQTAQALNAEDESYLRYTKYLEFTLVHDGWAVPLNAPVKVYVTLPDIGEGADALQVVRFDNVAPVLLDSERTENTVSFETEDFDVFGIGNALVPVTDHETELVKVEVLSFAEDAPVNLAEAEAPKVIEGLEVLGTFTVENNTEDAPETENQDGLFIKAELKQDAELNPMEGVALYSVDADGNTDILMEQLTEDAKITELEATQVAVIKDTGYRHLTLTVNPDETTEDQIVTLDGMMPKDAEAVIEEITEAHAEASGMELSEENYAVEETADQATEAEAAKEAEESGAAEQTAAEAEQTETGTAPEEMMEDAPETESEETTAEITDEASESATKLIAAYDITILNGEEAYQPGEDRPITVEILDSRITTGQNIELWHVKDDGTEEQVTEFTLEEGQITFEAQGFSVYKVVQAPEPVIINNKETVQSLEELAQNYNAPDSGANGFILSYNGAHYFTNKINSAANGALIETTSKEQASIWFLEKAGADDTYLIYSYPDGEKKYIHHAPNSSTNVPIEMASVGTPIQFTSAGTAKFYLKHADYTLYLQHSGSGGGIRFYGDHNNAANSQITLTYVTPPRNDDPYQLDGKSYGLTRYKEGVTSQAMMALATSDGKNLQGQKFVVKANPLDRSESLYVAKGTDISMWTFNSQGDDFYTLSTDVNGSTQYLKIENGKLTLVTTEGAASVIQVIPGTGSYEGKIRLKDKDNRISVQRSGNYFTGKGDSSGQADQWLNLVTESELGEDDFVPYSAQKVSIAEKANEVRNGDQVVIYTRIWDDTPGEEGYKFYIVDHNGDLFRAYEEGDSIQWIGTKINTVLWDFVEYYWESTNTPNYYYDLRNVYTGQYLAPQVSGSAFSNDPIGLNLNGRRYNDYYSTILAWDDPIYAYAGLKTEDGTIVPCRIGKAVDFYFAKMDPTSSGQLTPVPTIDHTKYGITMKMYNFSGKTVGSSIDTMHAVMGNSSYDDKGRTAGLLSTELGENGYPTATNTGKSLQQLFTGSAANEVNHLFLASTHSGSGYFSYDSAQNYARLNGGTFTVYKEIGSHNGKDSETMKHGQFFPYNDIDPNRYPALNPVNLYTSRSEELSEDNPRKYEQLCLIDNPDFYFGMEISASFVQTPNGKDAWKHDIIYEFTGDDDFWLYVDGELVIDLGGIHKALHGKVNFATGVVEINDKNNTTITDSLYNIFREHYIAQNGEEGLSDYLASLFTVKNGNYVFKDYSTHTMNIYYMERGGGASNLQMRFNLASVNPDQVQLSKEVSGIADAAYLTTKFPFQIWYQPIAGTEEYVTLAQDEDNEHGYVVTYKNTREGVEFSESKNIADIDYENVFFLKAGQTAEINMPHDIGKYYIVECGVAGNICNQHTNQETNATEYWTKVNDDRVDGTPAGDDGGYSTYDYQTSAAKVTERANVVFTNNVNPDYLRTLSITKELLAEDGQTSLTAEQDGTIFKYRLSMGGELDENQHMNLHIYNMGEYYIKNPDNEYCEYVYNPATGAGEFVSVGTGVFDNLSDAQKESVTFTSSPSGAIDRIKAGYTVEIRDLPVGTDFLVEERPADMPAGYTRKKYERVEGSYDEPETDAVNRGIIKASQNAHLTVVNQRGWGLTVEKEWTDKFFTSYHEPIYVAVYADQDATQLIPGTIRRIEHPAKSVYYYFDSLIAGTTFDQYTVREVQLSAANPTVGDDGTVDDSTAGTVTPVTDGVAVPIKAKDRSGADVDPDPLYLVTYEPGTATGVTGNVRTDEITNQRGGGIIFRLYEWNGETPLPEAVFTLKKGDETVGDETYISNRRGLVTVLYDFEHDVEYTLTEVAAPTGYQGLGEPLKFKIYKDEEQKEQIQVWTESDTWETWHDENTIDQSATGGDLIAYVNLKNRRYTLKAVKYDPAENDVFTPLSGATFALYKQFIGSNGQPVKDYAPLTGYSSLVSDDEGVVNLINEQLPPRTYYLTETKAPVGYEKKLEDILFTITPLGYVLSDTEGEVTSETLTDGTIAYTIKLPNMKLSLVPPVLYVTKTVEGNGAEETRPFRFTVSGLTPGREYVYQEFDYAPETDSGWTEGKEASALGLLTVDAEGKISFDLKHHERMGISLPYASDYVVAETGYGSYTPAYEWEAVPLEDSEAKTSVIEESASTVRVDSFISDVYIDYTNTNNDVPLPAPTGLKNNRTPYLLMMLLGILMLAGLGGAGIVRRKKRLPDTGPVKARIQTHKQWVEYRTPLVRGAPPSAPPCPRAGLGAKPSGSTGKRGDPGL